MSVGPGGDMEPSKSLRPTFFNKIGSEVTHSSFLYKTCWSSEGVNFLTMTDDGAGSAGISMLPDIREGTDVGTDL